eukprot:11684737-Prorocentrum_lima.AAC.1
MIAPGGLRGSGPANTQDHTEGTPMQDIANIARNCCKLREKGWLPATEDMAGTGSKTGQPDPHP